MSTNKKHILVTGSNGQVGSELQELVDHKLDPYSSLKDYEFIFTDVDELDITQTTKVAAFFELHNIVACINCAAYTAVDKAEEEKELAFKINAQAVELLAEACSRHNAKLLHISTDYVYHQDQGRPFTESAPTSPQSVYGKSKLAGDVAALQNCAKSLVLRTSWVYSSYGKNFVKTMLRLGTERDQLHVIFDQIGSPTYAADLAAVILHCLNKIEAGAIENWSGIYHYSNEGVCSWYDFAHAIFEMTETDCQLSPIETKDYPSAAVRPPFSLLNKAKIKSQFGVAIPHWRESLQKCLAKLL